MRKSHSHRDAALSFSSLSPSPSPPIFPNDAPSQEQHNLKMYVRPQQEALDVPPPVPSQSPDGGPEHLRDDTAGGDIEDEVDPERVSFLPRTERSYIDEAGDDVDILARPKRSPSVFHITIAASMLILIVDVVASVPMAPKLVIFEDIICRNHYAAWKDGLGSNDCKIEPVQSELAMINGWKETFDTIPGLIVSIPYGALANRIGRGKVLVLALLGSLLSESWVAIVCLLPQTFPLRTIWLSGLFQLIGGGGATVVAMCYTMIADVCSAEQRTTAFSQVHGAVLLSEMISIPLGSALIAVDPWIPVLSALGLMLLTMVIMILSAFYDASVHTRKHLTESLDIPPSPSAPSRKLQNRLRQVLAKVNKASPWINRNVLLILAAFFFCQLSRQFSSVLLQYSSFKFNWDFAEASYLIPLRAGINLLVLIVIIPRLTRFFVQKRGTRQSQADKYITVISGVCLVIGSLLIFLSAYPFTVIIGQIFIALGFAFTVTARSFLTTMVDPRYLSLLYTSVTAVTYGGLIVGGPLFAGLFQWGLHLGDFWIGLPFLVTAILFATATLAVSAVKSGTY